MLDTKWGVSHLKSNIIIFDPNFIACTDPRREQVMFNSTSNRKLQPVGLNKCNGLDEFYSLAVQRNY